MWARDSSGLSLQKFFEEACAQLPHPKSDVPLLSQPDKLHLQGPGRSTGTDHPTFTEDTLQPAQEAVPVSLITYFLLLL